jgi:hypothetical protein
LEAKAASINNTDVELGSAMRARPLNDAPPGNSFHWDSDDDATLLEIPENRVTLFVGFRLSLVIRDVRRLRR